MIYQEEPKFVKITVEYHSQTEERFVVGQDFAGVLYNLDMAFGGPDQESPKPKPEKKPRRKRRTKAEIEAADESAKPKPEKPRRKRRTKAEIEAAAGEDEDPKANPEDDPDAGPEEEVKGKVWAKYT